MARLEDIHAGTRVSGLTPTGVCEVVSVNWIGQQALKVVYRDPNSRASARRERASLGGRRRCVSWAYSGNPSAPLQNPATVCPSARPRPKRHPATNPQLRR